MSTSSWIYTALAVIIVILLAVYISHLAGRLDRAHLKVESTRSALLTNLAHRSSLAMEFANLAGIDATVAASVRAAARLARDEEVADSGWNEESVLTAAITAAVTDDATLAAAELDESATLNDLASLCRRVQYSRRFHNDAVRQARELRGRFLARTLRLAGRAALPEYIDFDDSVPPRLERT
jgi:hypothetical protein